MPMEEEGQVEGKVVGVVLAVTVAVKAAAVPKEVEVPGAEMAVAAMTARVVEMVAAVGW